MLTGGLPPTAVLRLRDAIATDQILSFDAFFGREHFACMEGSKNLDSHPRIGMKLNDLESHASFTEQPFVPLSNLKVNRRRPCWILS
jgi:hypothetical protein